jgi:glycosyltransferase involved in cell wall biosynthesis
VNAVPRVSLGLPVFNLERTVARAIESVVSQTFTDLELVVSDNASTDGTAGICRAYAARDARIRYMRQPRTVPAYENFRLVFETTRAPYFMWLAGDDYVLPSLLAQAVAVLDTRPDVVCCAARAEFAHPDGSREAAGGTSPLLGTPAENLCRFLEDPMDNSRFYGVHRREVLGAALPASSYHAFDWVISAVTLMAGKHWQLDEVGLIREGSHRDKYTRAIDTAFPTLRRRLLPLAPFTHAMLRDVRLPRSVAVLYRLFRLNVIHHVMYCQYRYPRYGHLAYRIGASLERLGNGVARRISGASQA